MGPLDSFVPRLRQLGKFGDQFQLGRVALRCFSDAVSYVVNRSDFDEAKFSKLVLQLK